MFQAGLLLIIRAINSVQTSDRNKFQIALKEFLLNNSFYSLEEYFNT